MSAPAHVPPRLNEPKSYRSPPRRVGSWAADRPGDVVGGPQPRGTALGNPGPDQGYVLKLAKRFVDDLVLTPREHAADAIEGACAVALRRASLHARAPVVDDVRIALTLFGYLDDCPDELVEWRRELFDEVHNSTLHYSAAREIADLVPESTLRMSVEEVTAASRQDWKKPLGL